MIEQFIITVLVIYGVKASTGAGMILEFIPNAIIKLFSGVFSDRFIVYMMKPFFDCTPCMASVYGTLSFVLYGDFDKPLLLSYLIWIFALSGCNYLINKIIQR